MKNNSRNTTLKVRGNNSSKKIGDIEPQQKGPASAFKLCRRMPGWRADTFDIPGFPDTKVYPEQALRVLNGNFNPFGHPNPKLSLFKEPSPTEPPASDPAAQAKWHAEWRDFNSWILGMPLKTINPTAFDEFLAEITSRVRRYNASLYWLRRLHFKENDSPINYPPEWNENGNEPKDLPDTSSLPGQILFSQLVSDAEDAWKEAVDSLNLILSGGETIWNQRGFESTSADMIEVNGYIVSMRIVSKAPVSKSGAKKPPFSATQFGGSSSSHISISSAFQYP